MDLLREKKIVNAGEILRFELEGLSAGLPSYKRVLGYEVWFEPLPRTTTEKLKRHEIVRRLKQASHAAPAAAAVSAEPDAWQDDPHVGAAMALVRRRVDATVPCRSTSNLELDLGLDSMARVELLTDLEQEFGVRVPEEHAHEIFTIGQLIDAVRPRSGPSADGSSRDVAPEGRPVPSADRSRSIADESWAVLLRDLPPITDPVLSGLLEPRPLLEPLLLLFVRLAARIMSRVAATGLDKLPRGGAFLICPNHQSYVDPFFVCGVLPSRTLARAFFVGAVEYFETPLMKWVARQAHCVPVDPDSNLVPAMKAGAFGLAHGKVLILFPEGERSIDGTVKRFKKGAPILSRHMAVPVVPVAIKGAHEVWPRGGSFNWRGLLPWSRSHVKVQFGDPIQFAEGESYADAATGLREVVDRMWRKL
jgi:long-chain acyl-CoA synthetase